jgi:hypothetical protein
LVEENTEGNSQANKERPAEGGRSNNHHKWKNNFALIARSTCSFLKDSLKKPDNFPQFLVAIFTLLLAVFAVLAWVEATRGTKAIQGQLDVMKSDQRPWIKVEAEIWSDLTFQGDIGALPVRFFLKNVGKYPAFDADVWIKTFLMADGHTDLFEEQRKYCASTRAFGGRKSNDVINGTHGVFLFPDEKIPWLPDGTIVSGGVGPGEIKEFSKVIDGKRQINIWIYGCATYDQGRPDTVHQTGFVFQLARRVKPGGPISYSFSPDDPVPKDLLLLFPAPSADGITN